MSEEMLTNEATEETVGEAQTADKAETPVETPEQAESPVEVSEAAGAAAEVPETAEASADAPEAAEDAADAPTEAPAESMADYEDALDQASPWNRVRDYLEKGTKLTVKVEGVVKGGVVAKVEEIRAFIPASQLSLHYVENLEDYLLQDIEVQVIEADEEDNRLILSARNLLREKARAERAERIRSIPVGTVIEGKVETIKPYGAFVRFDGNLSGLVHVSQISTKRIKTPADVLKEGDTIKAKVIAIKDGKISLSMKALADPASERAPEEKVVIPKAENIGTSLGDLLGKIKL